MYLEDELYGEHTAGKVLEELILSKPMQRLKGVHQGGASYLVNKEWNETRYDHSVGVMLLIKTLGGSVEEQIAGLLHDVSHTAFSHVVDHVYENTEENYHERIYRKVIETSEIPAILKKYGYDYKDLLFDDSRWTLLEQPAPELCADRVDSTLRDMYKYGQISLTEVHSFLSSITVSEGKMYPENIETAEWFVETYYKEVIDFFMDPLNIYGYDTLTRILKLSLDKNIISSEDFLKEDEEVMRKLKDSGDRELSDLLSILNAGVQVIEDHSHFTIHRKNKIRIIDPSVLYNGKLIRASLLSRKVKDMNEAAYRKAANGMYVKVLSG
ncbi:HD domain-containing protein [Alteribacter natronophilus]|uniref:HD domain-containing protein n=1 Tax=Alteribacter natronophilus TaxID=2583810 RepID=UPI00110D4F5B|nr:HD domain-containing protein [Alteribacter natronophilus]TMW70373.1 HD domain-containing protein [Alteribacter natronophilus]